MSYYVTLRSTHYIVIHYTIICYTTTCYAPLQHSVQSSWCLLKPNSKDWGFLGGTVVKNPPAKAGNTRDVSSIPKSKRSPGIGNGNPLQFFAWKTPWTEEPDRLQYMGLQKSQTQLSNLACACACTHTHPITAEWEFKSEIKGIPFLSSAAKNINSIQQFEKPCSKLTREWNLISAFTHLIEVWSEKSKNTIPALITKGRTQPNHFLVRARATYLTHVLRK